MNTKFENVPKISPVLSNELIKLIEDEIDKSLKNISDKYNIEHSEISFFKPNINKISTIIGLKKRIRRTLPNELMCMGRKLDGEQCTRSRLNNKEYCLTHQKRLPNGRIDDENYVKKEKGKRGRKKKFSEIENSEDYIPTRIIEINNTKYLKDFDNNVYTYNISEPTLIGKFCNNTLIPIC